ncbi:MAG: hypothetical protein RL346_1014 [Verrucomicrobiota bacterium]
MKVCMGFRRRANVFMSQSKPATPLSGTPLNEILDESSAFDQFMSKHQVKLAALVLLAVVAALSMVVIRGIEDGKEKEAGAMLARQTDAESLKRLIKEFPGTAAASSSKILLAQSLWDDGKQDESIAALKALTDSGLEHPAVSSARASLAAKWLAQGKREDAEKILRSLTEDKAAGYLAAYAWLTLGDMALAKGDLAAAEKAYQTVERDFSGTSYVGEAMSRRMMMKAENPTVVAAPIGPLDTKIISGDEKIENRRIEDALNPPAPQESLPPGNVPEPGPAE